MGKKLIITPQEFAQGRNPQETLIDINRRLVRELDIRRRQVAERDTVIQAMNAVFTKLAEKVGTPIPTGKDDGPAALEAMFTKIDSLIEKQVL